LKRKGVVARRGLKEARSNSGPNRQEADVRPSRPDERPIAAANASPFNSALLYKEKTTTEMRKRQDTRGLTNHGSDEK
jgi:hypothetical protein